MSFHRIPAAVLAAGVLVSCTPREDPGITEKIALLEAELRSRDEQLAAMQEESSSETSTASNTGAPDLDAAKAGYLGAVETLRKNLAEALPGAKFDRTSVFPVEGPDPSKPILSRAAFRIVSQEGRTGEIVVPLFANPAGEWQQPPTSEIVTGFKAGQSAPPVTAQTPAPQPAEPPKSKPTDVMGANRTVEIQWGDKPAAPPVQQSAAPQSTTPPPAPAVPKKVMPTQRDVIIDFE